MLLKLDHNKSLYNLYSINILAVYAVPQSEMICHHHKYTLTLAKSLPSITLLHLHKIFFLQIFITNNPIINIIWYNIVRYRISKTLVRNAREVILPKIPQVSIFTRAFLFPLRNIPREIIFTLATFSISPPFYEPSKSLKIHTNSNIYFCLIFKRYYENVVYIVVVVICLINCKEKSLSSP